MKIYAPHLDAAGRRWLSIGHTSTLHAVATVVGLLAFAVSQAALAAALQCSQVVSKDFVPSKDSAVELELMMSRPLLRLLTTTNEKVSGLLMNGEQLPEWFVSGTRLTHPEVTDASDLRWDDIEAATQLHLLQSVSSERNQKFFEDRQIHGIVVRKQVTAKFKERVSLLGKVYEPGEHQIDISSVFGGKVEYIAPSSMKSVGGVELHFRTNKKSGDVSNDAWTLLDGIQIARPHQHVHIVATLPTAHLQASPEIYPVMMGDYVRRVNLAAEFITIVEERGTIRGNATKTEVFFDSLSPERLRGITNYFLAVAKGENPRIGDRFKMGWVGMRGSDKYDGPVNLWGLEIRSISQSSDPQTVNALLDATQHGMQTETYGVSSERIESWLKLIGNESPLSAVGDSLYNQDFKKLYANANESVCAQFGGFTSIIKKLNLKVRSQRSQEVKMLVHDWSNDPLFYDRPDLQARIADAQVIALKRLWTGRRTNSVMRDFLKNSGLFDEVLGSVGLLKPTAH